MFPISYLTCQSQYIVLSKFFLPVFKSNIYVFQAYQAKLKGKDYNEPIACIDLPRRSWRLRYYFTPMAPIQSSTVPYILIFRSFPTALVAHWQLAMKRGHILYIECMRYNQAYPGLNKAGYKKKFCKNKRSMSVHDLLDNSSWYQHWKDYIMYEHLIWTRPIWLKHAR